MIYKSMWQSKLFGKTSREAPADEVSVNAKLLARAGFVDKLASGIYSFLPLGLRSLKKIEQVIREEMNAIGGQELLLPALHPKENWEKTGRWKDPGREVMFQLTGRGDREYGLGWTHEEVITPLVKRFMSSYKDLPLALYQIQHKFRDEPRAKSGLLRGREFLMKDLYSFHTDEQDLDAFYALSQRAYARIFERVGLKALRVEASGGTFSKFSHEFQVPTPAGEDIVVICDSCSEFAQNKEIAEVEAGDKCPKCGKPVRAERAIEVGNIFRLKTKYSQAFRLTYKDEHGKDQLVLMGCYGIGLGRTLGAIVEVHHDDKGIIWPTAVAPFDVHLIALQEDKKVRSAADKLYAALQKSGLEVLYDERAASAGEKLTDADLIGIPVRLVVSEKTVAVDSVEIKRRAEKEAKLVKMKDVAKYAQ